MAPPDPNTDLFPGALLAGKYRLQVEIGRGAMGTVWRALNENIDQLVALKVISPEHANSAELRERFDTEARAAAKLSSRFVVSVYDNGETRSGLPFIVMELLHGECLEDRIARQGCLPLPEVSRIARHLTRALSKAHSHGVIHRDLKPANIFLTISDEEEDGDNWTAKVLDFGIAKVEAFSSRSVTQTGTVLGTPLFMSPEQVRGANSVDNRADLYSFGMVVFNMFTGTFAFEGQSFGDLLVSICVDPLPNISHFAPHVPRGVDAWFQKACARNPGDRFHSAEEMYAALQVVLGEQQAPASLQMTATATVGTMATPVYPGTSAYPEINSETSWPRPAPDLSSSPDSSPLDSAAAASMTVRHAPQRSGRGLLLAGLACLCLFAGGAWAALRFTAPSGLAEPAAPTPVILEIPEPVETQNTPTSLLPSAEPDQAIEGNNATESGAIAASDSTPPTALQESGVLANSASAKSPTGHSTTPTRKAQRPSTPRVKKKATAPDLGF